MAYCQKPGGVSTELIEHSRKAVPSGPSSLYHVLLNGLPKWAASPPAMRAPSSLAEAFKEGLHIKEVEWKIWEPLPAGDLLNLNYFELNLIDSLRVLEFVTAIEERFRIRFRQEDFQDPGFSTIEGLTELIAGL